MIKNVLSVLFVLLVVACAPATERPVPEKKESIRADLIVEASTHKGVFRIYSFNGSLLIDYLKKNMTGSTAIYNPHLGIFSSVSRSEMYGKTHFGDRCSFYVVENAHIRKILESLIDAPEKYKNPAAVRELQWTLDGGLPYLTYDGEYKGKKTSSPLRGQKYFQTLQEQGVSFEKLFSSNNRRPISTTHEGKLPGTLERFAREFSAIKNLEATNILVRARMASEERETLERFSESIKVDAKILNFSGYPYPSDLIGYNRELLAGKDLESARVKISPYSKNPNYLLRFKPKHTVVSYKEKTQETPISIEVVKKRYTGLNVSKEYKNNEVAVFLKAIKLNTSGDIEALVDLSNMENKYVSLKSISVYMNDTISTWSEQNIELPPNGILEDKVFIIRKETKYFSQWLSAVENFVTKKEAETSTAKIKVSAKYVIGNTVKTLFKELHFRYSDIINI